jgi:hypothetical protein
MARQHGFDSVYPLSDDPTIAPRRAPRQRRIAFNP